MPSSRPLHSLAVIAMLSLSAVRLIAAEPVRLTADRPVLCWYMVCYFTSVDHYMEEMALAQSHGIDGFLLDVGQWKHRDAKRGELKPSNYSKAVARIFEAAEHLGTGFGLAMAPENYIGKHGLAENVKDMLRIHHGHPNYFHYQGRPLLATYIGRPAQWGEALTELREQEGIDPFWVGNFWNPRWAMHWSVETARSFFRESAELDGLINFGTMGTALEVATNANGRYATILEHKAFVAGVNPTYNSSNVIDRRGMDGYGALWKGAIEDGADMVGIVIWNDYNEDSNLYPGRWPFGSQKQYVSRDESFLDVTAYHSAWYKTRVQPKIAQDKFYAVYRTRTKWQDRGWDAKKRQWVRIRNRPYPYDQFHDDNEDNLYVTTFLTAPAQMTVALGKKRRRQTMPAGVRTMAVPLTSGVPRFALRRGGQILADVVGGRQVIAEETKQNSAVDGGKHLLYRNFTYGSAIGPVVKRLPAADAKLLGNATRQTVAHRKGVQTQATAGSGLELPVTGLKTATYNLRIIYSNPGVDDARLTMTINGGRSDTNGEDKPYERALPVSFPPTGKGTLATTSLLWSLFETTTRLTLEYRLGQMFGKPDASGDDRGSVFIEKLELIEVKPTLLPKSRDFAVPELVFISGGGFTMGSDRGNPDEAPARKVTLSPFAVGKFEITNEQFEAFMPKHRQFRDQYSWRDSDPVIYVKWLEAAAYCNWLSEHQGLEPVYNTKTGVADLAKAGYRLPSEAQWEYVAAGRNENRRFVWGAADPAPEHCHTARARGEPPNPIPRALPAAGIMPGVVPVGSFALDRTRDGVMDMAGNVAEWCGDWFDTYDPKDLMDPFQAAVSATKYRAIRGGSWGYYSYSLRVADREYNTQVYPGYIYIGSRVVLPEAGYRRLAQNNLR
ncbi:MAG: SUMF1/EgtB/PvdO family nonheme iron enzyme [Lentisphaerae bacterium]|nr:SUMF1/EgtB/PvdO family nonheme iron enzyme [Lentisphaerota bacterium]MBT5612573.1 SUMF1/EgtB/PvdO family nonheme iron enzyme [Lentisphaerota bacterium]MBT7844955.1 SUMF1/EgtB/PvdO family nonheme iron enzyme [Lentisphaerota bacterium]